MLAKIFLSTFLLACMYTYTLKPLKINDYNNFQKVSNDFNSDSSEKKPSNMNLTQAVKPTLEFNVNYLYSLRSSLRSFLGDNFIDTLDKFTNNKDYLYYFDRSFASRVKSCKNTDDFIKLMDESFTPILFRYTANFRGSTTLHEEYKTIMDNLKTSSFVFDEFVNKYQYRKLEPFNITIQYCGV